MTHGRPQLEFSYSYIVGGANRSCVDYYSVMFSSAAEGLLGTRET